MIIFREVLIFIITIIIAIIIQLPIIKEIDYKFLFTHSSIIVLGIVYIWHIFSFESTISKLNKWLRYIVFSMNFIVILLIFIKTQKIIELYDISLIEKFQNTYKALSYDNTEELLKYIKISFLFSSMVLFASTLILSIKILKSFWYKKYIKDY